MWIWQEDTRPFISCDFELKDENNTNITLMQSYIRFSQDSSREFVTTGKKYFIYIRAIFFWSWDQAVRGFEYYK